MEVWLIKNLKEKHTQKGCNWKESLHPPEWSMKESWKIKGLFPVAHLTTGLLMGTERFARCATFFRGMVFVVGRSRASEVSEGAQWN